LLGPSVDLLSSSVFLHEEGNRTSFQNVVFLKILDDGQSPKQHFQAIYCTMIKKNPNFRVFYTTLIIPNILATLKVTQLDREGWPLF
jgi:hypothetical protein